LAIQKNKEDKNAVESAFSLYKSARATYLDVLLTQQNALQSEIELVNTARRLKIANIKLYKSLGGGWR
jgi:outer membrane protein TolC